jgi:ankyrin repeat protein
MYKNIHGLTTESTVHLKMVKLFSKTADINIKNKKGDTPLDVARSMNHMNIVRFLEKQYLLKRGAYWVV